MVSEALTPQLQSAIQSELALLGAHHLPLNLKPSASKGETLHQLELKGARPDRLVTLSKTYYVKESNVSWHSLGSWPR